MVGITGENVYPASQRSMPNNSHYTMHLPFSYPIYMLFPSPQNMFLEPTLSLINDFTF